MAERILDSNIVLDFLLKRESVNPFWAELPLRLIQDDIPICLAAHQVATIGDAFEREARRLGLTGRPESRQIWSKLLDKATIVKTPATLDLRHPLQLEHWADRILNAPSLDAVFVE